MKTNSRVIDKKNLPFGMLYKDDLGATDRGYALYPENWSYDAITQISELLRMGGPTEPTTVSATSSTGAFKPDSDQSNDDKGTD